MSEAALKQIKGRSDNPDSVRTGSDSFTESGKAATERTGGESSLNSENSGTSDTESVLVVAFDGMDRELVKKFDLENISQDEFGKIDNQTGMKTIITGELFSSFITGKTYKEHGKTGIGRPIKKDVWKKKVLDIVSPKWFRDNVRGFHRLSQVLKTVLNYRTRYYLEEDFEEKTLFDRLEDSRPMYIPCYNPSPVLLGNVSSDLLEMGFSFEKKLEVEHKFDLEVRKRDLLKELENEILEPRSLLMCHLHSPDQMQHVYGDNQFPERYDERKMKEKYRELDKFAGKVKNKALDKGYDYVIFLSDHGRPLKHGEHNENAFYSSNKELFPSQEPKITSFYDKIISLASAQVGGGNR